MRTEFVLVFAVLVAVTTLPAGAATDELGEAPMCEASAVLRVPCGERDCVLVGDNEVRDRLYRFPIKDLDLEAQGGRELPLGEVEISDIESLVSLGGNRILVLGSHSRNKRCDTKKSRRRFVVVEHSESSFGPAAETIQTKKISCDRLFVDDANFSETLKAVCKRIDETEERADAIFDALDVMGRQATEEACGKAAPFNIEGAVAIPGTGGPEVWVGLRGPLVEMDTDGEGSKKAVMLRMKNQEALRFEAAALLDLEGLAIRELTVAGGWVWGIGGPPEDSSADFKLWRFPIRSLQPDVAIEPEWIGKLPTSSEGLALFGSTAFIVIDGDQGANECAVPARYRVVRTPNY